jgi:hypothetical protein
MKPNPRSVPSVLKEIGKVRWTPYDAFEVKTELGARFLLSPNNDEGLPSRVHIDEILVPEPLQRKGVGTRAMRALCDLADKYQFRLDGGPIGWSESLWREKFVEWVTSFGFKRDATLSVSPVIDPDAFYVFRQPKPTVRT